MSNELLIYWHGVILLLLKVLLFSNLSFGGCSLPRLPLVGADLANQLLTPLKIRNDCLCLGAGCCWLLLATGTSPYHDPLSSPLPLSLLDASLLSRKPLFCACEFVLWTKALAPKSDDPHLIPRTHVAEGDTNSPNCPLTSPYIHRMNKHDICFKKKNHHFVGETMYSL